MAQFKVGDRVRKARTGRRNPEVPVGTTGTIIGCGDVRDWLMNWDSLGTENNGNRFGIDSHLIEPLTPPAEDAWASEQVRKVCKPQHVEPVAPVRERTV